MAGKVTPMAKNPNPTTWPIRRIKGAEGTEVRVTKGIYRKGKPLPIVGKEWTFDYRFRQKQSILRNSDSNFKKPIYIN